MRVERMGVAGDSPAPVGNLPTGKTESGSLGTLLSSHVNAGFGWSRFVRLVPVGSGGFR